MPSLPGKSKTSAGDAIMVDSQPVFPLRCGLTGCRCGRPCTPEAPQPVRPHHCRVTARRRRSQDHKSETTTPPIPTPNPHRNQSQGERPQRAPSQAVSTPHGRPTRINSNSHHARSPSDPYTRPRIFRVSRAPTTQSITFSPRVMIPPRSQPTRSRCRRQ